MQDSNNLPQYWLKTPTSENVEVFREKINGYKKPAKSTRKLLLTSWISDVEKEGMQPVDPVTKLGSVRTLGKENIWPCPECTEFGEDLFCSVSTGLGIPKISQIRVIEMIFYQKS